MLVEIIIFMVGMILTGFAVYLFRSKEIKRLESIVNDKKAVINSLQDIVNSLIKNNDKKFDRKTDNRLSRRKTYKKKKFDKNKLSRRSMT